MDLAEDQAGRQLKVPTKRIANKILGQLEGMHGRLVQRCAVRVGAWSALNACLQPWYYLHIALTAL